MDENLRRIPGFNAVLEHFGYCPTFHDAEVVSLLLNRDAESHLDVHFFHTYPDLNEHGSYRTTKHAIFRFTFTGILMLELSGFNHQNVLADLDIVVTNDDSASSWAAAMECVGKSKLEVCRSQSRREFPKEVFTRLPVTTKGQLSLR